MHSRGVTLVEIMVVAAVAMALAAASMASMASITSRQKNTRAMEQVLFDVQQQRVAHVAAGREELLAVCVDCIDDTGAPRTPTNPHVVNVYLIDDPLKPDQGRPAFTATYEDVELSLVGVPHVAIDALGRSVTCDTREPTTAKLQLDLDGQRKETITFGGDGKLTPSFGDVLPPLAPHAQNLSARTTPNPMPRGSFTGDATRATGLTLH